MHRGNSLRCLWSREAQGILHLAQDDRDDYLADFLGRPRQRHGCGNFRTKIFCARQKKLFDFDFFRLDHLFKRETEISVQGPESAAQVSERPRAMAISPV